jgi:SAM-dependent methyltransferase
MDAVSERLCPACGRPAPIGIDDFLWPPRWCCPACNFVAPVSDGIVLTAPALADTVSGIDPAGFGFLSRVEADHFWFATRRALILYLVDRYFPSSRRLVEIGCGSGNVLAALASSRRWQRVAGTDLHPSGLSLARGKLSPSIELLQLDARHVPFRSAFDLIGAFDVLEHIVEDEFVLQGFAAALENGGGLIVTVPQHPALWSSSDDVAYHVRRYRRGEVEQKVARAGFQVLFSSSFTALLLPLMWANRLLTKRAVQTDDAVAAARQEFALSPRLNAILGSVNRIEVAMTAKGMRWPFGGSRVVCARKR